MESRIRSEPAVLRVFDQQEPIARLWKGPIHTDKHAKAQGCARGFWVLYGTLKQPNLDHKLEKVFMYLMLNLAYF